MSRYRSGNLFFAILELSKVRITVAVAVTTIAGYILAARDYRPGFVLPTIGIFLLACGSSVLNHLQERRTDALMPRTRLRPVPDHRVSTSFALGIALAETLAGSVILYLFAGTEALILGLSAMIWYNGIYTNLKKITPHAVIPGSVIGAIPPLVGWVSAGEDLLSIRAGVLALFFFTWQVPHFYLLAMKYGPEYQKAGLPAITSRWSTRRAAIHIYAWVILTACCAVLLTCAGLSGSRIGSAAIILCCLMLPVAFRRITREKSGSFPVFRYFMKINYFVLAVTLILIAGPFLHRVFRI